MLTDLEQEKVIALVKKAAVAIMAYWPGDNKAPGKLEIKQKPDGSSVTNADLLSNEIIIAGLKENFPLHAIISEEIALDPACENTEFCWLIDPIDGTSHFIRGQDDFSILLASTQNHKVIFGVMFFPAMQFYAVGAKGLGAYVNSEKKLQVSTVNKLTPNSVYIRNFEPVTRTPVLAEPLDSGRAFFKLFEGDLLGIIIKASTFGEWDIAAPALMVNESGGKVTNEKGEEILFNTGLPIDKNSYIVASNGLVHEELLKLIPQ